MNSVSSAIEDDFIPRAEKCFVEVALSSMRLRALVLVCVVVAVLSGIALFSPFYRFRGGWLDGLFLTAVAVIVLVALRRFAMMAERSVAGSVEQELRDDDQSTWRND